jgi:acetyl esterase/lipase
MQTSCVASHSKFEDAPATARSTVERRGGTHRAAGGKGRWSTLAAALGLLATYAILSAPGLGLAATGSSPAATPTASSSPSSEVAPPPRDAVDVAYGPLPEQVFDVHLPSGVTGPFPVVVFAHAGGWFAGTRSAIPDVIRTLVADDGVAVVSIDYRLVASAPDGRYLNTFPTASYDMDRAVRFVRANAARWDLDPDRIIAAGASAGGQLAAMAGVAPGTYADPSLPRELARVSPVVEGVIDYVGPSDFSTFTQAGGWAPALTAGLLDCEPDHPETCDPARVAEASIATHLSAAAPPAYLAYGEQDSLVVPATQGAPLAQAWASQRGDFARPDPQRRGVWYEQQANADHNFDLLNSDYMAMERWVRSVVAGTLK